MAGAAAALVIAEEPNCDTLPYEGAEVAERDAAGRECVRRGGEPFSIRVAERVSSSS